VLVKPAMDDIFIKRDLAMLRVLPLLLFGAYLLKGAARYGPVVPSWPHVGERVNRHPAARALPAHPDDAAVVLPRTATRPTSCRA